MFQAQNLQGGVWNLHPLIRRSQRLGSTTLPYTTVRVTGVAPARAITPMGSQPIVSARSTTPAKAHPEGIAPSFLAFQASAHLSMPRVELGTTIRMSICTTRPMSQLRVGVKGIEPIRAAKADAFTARPRSKLVYTPMSGAAMSLDWPLSGLPEIPGSQSGLPGITIKAKQPRAQ